MWWLNAANCNYPSYYLVDAASLDGWICSSLWYATIFLLMQDDKIWIMQDKLHSSHANAENPIKSNNIFLIQMC